MAKKRVLIVTYYWPPSGGAFSAGQNLPSFCRSGVEPVIVTPSNPDVPVTDASLNDEIQPNTLVWAYQVHEPTRWLRAIGLGGASSSRLGAGGRKALPGSPNASIGSEETSSSLMPGLDGFVLPLERFSRT